MIKEKFIFREKREIKNKKSCDALAKSDARADQKRRINFTSPYGNCHWVHCRKVLDGTYLQHGLNGQIIP